MFRISDLELRISGRRPANWVCLALPSGTEKPHLFSSSLANKEFAFILPFSQIGFVWLCFGFALKLLRCSLFVAIRLSICE